LFFTIAYRELFLSKERLYCVEFTKDPMKNTPMMYRIRSLTTWLVSLAAMVTVCLLYYKQLPSQNTVPEVGTNFPNEAGSESLPNLGTVDEVASDSASLRPMVVEKVSYGMAPMSSTNRPEFVTPEQVREMQQMARKRQMVTRLDESVKQ